MKLAENELKILTRLVGLFGDYIEAGDYSFFKDLTTVESNIMIRALAYTEEIEPFAELNDVFINVDTDHLWNFYRDLPYLLRDAKDFSVAYNWAPKKEDQKKLMEVARAVGLNLYELAFPVEEATSYVISKLDKQGIWKELNRRYPSGKMQHAVINQL